MKSEHLLGESYSIFALCLARSNSNSKVILKKQNIFKRGTTVLYTFKKICTFIQSNGYGSGNGNLAIEIHPFSNILKRSSLEDTAR